MVKCLLREKGTVGAASWGIFLCLQKALLCRIKSCSLRRPLKIRNLLISLAV